MPKIPTRTDDAGFFSFRRLLDPSRRRRRQRRQMIKVRPEESDAATGDRQRARDSECHAAGNARKGLRVQSASKRKGEVRGLFVNQRISQDCCMTRGGGVSHSVISRVISAHERARVPMSVPACP